MRYTIFIFIWLLTISCSQDDVSVDPVRVGYPFFPLEVGQYQVFDVEETVYTFQNAETESFQIRLEVVDSFLNQAGEFTYVIHQFERIDEMNDWGFLQTNSARRTTNQAIFVNGNLPELKLSFPIEAGRAWDGNALNTLEPDEYEMDSLFSTFITLRGDTINQTLTVIQEDNQDLIVNQVTRHEIYALNIGLVYSEQVDLEYCGDPDCIGQRVVENGSIFKQTLIEYGKN